MSGHESQLAAALGQALASVDSVKEPAKHARHGEEQCRTSSQQEALNTPDQASPNSPQTADAQEFSPARPSQTGNGKEGISTPAPSVQPKDTAPAVIEHQVKNRSSSTSPLATDHLVSTSATSTTRSSSSNSSSSGPADISPPHHEPPPSLQPTASTVGQGDSSAARRDPSAPAGPSQSPAGAVTPEWLNTRLQSSGQLPHLLSMHRASEDNGFTSSPSATVSSPVKRPNINTAKSLPSRDVVASNAEVVPSLQVQYQALSSSTAVSLSVRCALLCERHCISLRDISGEFGETTALDIGCSTGGSSFELALSFSHVLGLDSDPMLVLAAKEMKESGVLEYHLNPDQPACYARVNPDVDRDRVRFWQYGLPELPPKLHVVDAVLVEAVEVRKQPWLRRILEQVPGLLKPLGTCVVVLPWDGNFEGTNPTTTTTTSSSSGRDMDEVGHVRMDGGSSTGGVGESEGGTSLQPLVTAAEARELLGNLGMSFVTEERFEYPVREGAELGFAHAMVWHHN